MLNWGGPSSLYFDANEDLLYIVEVIKTKFWPFASHNGQTPLFGAAKNGNLSTIKALCARLEISDVVHQDENGSTPLHFGAEHGHADVIVYIIRFANSKNRQIVDVQVRFYYSIRFSKRLWWYFLRIIKEKLPYIWPQKTVKRTVWPLSLNGEPMLIHSDRFEKKIK